MATTARGFFNSTAHKTTLLRALASTASMWPNSTELANVTDTDDSNDKGINLASKEAVIGVSCIAVSMVLITAFFCASAKRRNQNSESIISVHIKRNNAHSCGDSIVIQQLNVSRDLSEEEQLAIEAIGLRPFLLKEITAVIQDKFAKNETIQAGLAIQQVINVFLPQSKTTHDMGPYDLIEDITVKYNPRKNRCNFFATILPPLTQTTLLFETLFGAVQDLGSMQLSPSILPISRSASNDISIFQIVLSTVFGLGMLYISPGQAFMGDLGSKIDRKLINLFTCRKENTPSEPAADISKAVKIKIRLAQAALALFVLNSLYAAVIGDYQSTVSLNDRINALDDSLIPPWAVLFCSMMEFGLNQLNDPVMLFSELLMGTTLIYAYFNNKPKPKAIAQLEEIKTDAMKKDIVEKDDETGEAAIIPTPSTPPPTNGLQTLGKFSPKRTTTPPANSTPPKINLTSHQEDLRQPLLSTEEKKTSLTKN